VTLAENFASTMLRDEKKFRSGSRRRRAVIFYFSSHKQANKKDFIPLETVIDIIIIYNFFGLRK
jgi:hypothetical protein